MKLVHFNEKEHSAKNLNAKAKKIINFKPNIVLLEYPKETQVFFNEINRFSPLEKPKKKVERFKKSLIINSKKYPWLKADIKVIEEIEKLWNKNKQVYLFAIDGYVELTSVKLHNGLSNLVWNYLRELYMSENIKKLKQRFSKKKILIFCHNYHWKNIQYILKHYSKNKIWNYYFKKEGIASVKELENRIKKRNKILYKYWKMKKIK